MGMLEARNAQKRRRANIQKLILQSIAVGGLVGVALVAPNVLGSMKKLGLTPSQRQREIIVRAQKRLEGAGLLKRDNGKLSLTKRGEILLQGLSENRYAIRKPKRWDELWRVLIFDIPEPKKAIRNRLRGILASVGFIRLQDSVWVYPYPCEETIALLKTDFRLDKEMLYMIVETMERDSSLRRQFGLAQHNPII